MNRVALAAGWMLGLVLGGESIAAAPPAAVESGRVVIAESLMAQPFRDAKPLAQLPVGTPVQILQRQGGWYQVKSGTASGWLRMLSVRRAEAPKASLARDASSLLGLASGRAGTGTVVATTGIRGLDEEQLKSAAFSESGLAESDAFVVSEADAKAFAARGKLVPRTLDYLPEPARPGDAHE